MDTDTPGEPPEPTVPDEPPEAEDHVTEDHVTEDPVAEEPPVVDDPVAEGGEPGEPDTAGSGGGGRARWWALAGLVAMVAVAVVGWWGPWRDTSEPSQQSAARSPTTTPGATTSVVVPNGPVAPLTGVPVSQADAARLLRPALVAKVDASAEAMPQIALGRADVVLEVRVEGISRYLAAFQSQDVHDIGPIRSARTTDPDLLAMFGHPLFAFSGGNQGVLRRVRASDWIQDVSEDAAPAAYHRGRDQPAPHNLIADAPTLWSMARDPVVVPTPLFAYRAAGSPAPGVPTAGIAVSVGSDARFAWDEQRRGWLRWAFGTPHADDSGTRIAPTNVVVLQTNYVASPADNRSPEAVSVGFGRAWVLSGGRMVEGIWSRADRTQPWTLRDAAGAPMTLEPGTTWVELADGPPLVLGRDAVAALPTSPAR